MRSAYHDHRRSAPRRGASSTLVVLVVCVLLTVQGIAVLGSREPGAVPVSMETRSVSEQYPLWIDLLDNTGHVYMLPTGLAGVEVADGEARLKQDKTEGWLASSIISCPVGYRYDFIWIEAVLPGNSYIEVSLLDATEESTGVGFANETITGFVRLRSTEASVYKVDPEQYPHVRIQVDLHADGDDRPRVLSWALYFVGEEEWIDDFIGMGKMADSKGIVLDGGQLSLDHSRKGASGGTVEYPEYPSIAMLLSTSGYNYFYAYYADSSRTTYEEPVQVYSNRTARVSFDDLDFDGYLDLMMANGAGSSSYYAEIWWGSSSGTFSSTGSTQLSAQSAYGIDSGDFNGDGYPDVAVAAYGSGSGTYIYFGDGTRSFSATADVTLPYYFYLKAGDVDGDGYDDCVVWAYESGYYYVKVHLGGPSGPGTTADVSISMGSNNYNHMIVEDLDGDERADIVATQSGQQYIFLGGPSGPSTTPDYSLNPTNGYGWKCGAGDVNGDGLTDVVILSRDVIDVYEGTSSGWSDSNKHVIDVGYTTNALCVADVDKDGYDDVVSQCQNALEVYQGSPSWTMTRIVRKSSISSAHDMDIAVPKGPTARNYTGHFMTGEISLPAGKKWDVLDLSARMEPNTTLRITLLDDRGRAISGFDNVSTRSMDISHLRGTSIRVRVDISSELNTTSPWLDRLTVTWIDEMSWMDRFYGTTRVDRLYGLMVSGGTMMRSTGVGFGATLVFPSIEGDAGETPSGLAFTDSGGLSYNENPTIDLGTPCVAAADRADIDGDGQMDIGLAVYMSGTSYSTDSQIHYGTAVGWKDEPDVTFPTVGARDVLLRDLNGDGHIDVVFAQETDGTTCIHPSVLFWGSDSGFNTTADVTFSTTGATAVKAADVDGDGLLDLIFACSRATSSACDSMVFLQRAAGFDGSSPSHRLPTQSARAVAVGDVDGDGRKDIVFANNFSTGMVEIDSYIYWGRSGGGFDPSPACVRTMGATDVAIADLDGDGDQDLVFSNAINNERQYEVVSYVYLNGGGGTLEQVPDVMLPTVGASSVSVLDIDGTGWKDLVFSCQRNSTCCSQDSLVYLGGPDGYGKGPDIRLPTVGASDVIAIPLGMGTGGYLSEPIAPDSPKDVGNFHTLSYMATTGATLTGSIQLIDAKTWDVIAEESLHTGMHEWRVTDVVRYKDHRSVRVAIVATGIDVVGGLTIDNLRLNWTHRTPMTPTVDGIDVSETQVLRGDQVTFFVNASDEFDPSADLRIELHHRIGGGAWMTYMMGTPAFIDGAWQTTFTPRRDSEIGWYDIRVRAWDSDGTFSEYAQFPSLVKVLNNLPTAPVVRILPELALTSSTLSVEITRSSTDLESFQLTYGYRWYIDGMPLDKVTSDTVPSSLTGRGQNWSVEVWSNDGLDDGPPGTAWTVIQNSAPRVNLPLEPLAMDEDTVDIESLKLEDAFIDPDGDPITWSLAEVPAHLDVIIDPLTGAVTVTPEADWSGEEDLVFVGSDGEMDARQTVSVTVGPVNDPPRFSTIDGQPIVGTPVRLTVLEDETLTVQLDAFDVEGSEFRFSCNVSRFEIDIRTGELVFTPENDDVGTIHFSVTVWEIANQDVTSSLDLELVVVNVNDPMGNPRISRPAQGATYTENQTVLFQGSCDDPDVLNGQVLNYTWSSDLSGVLGYGPKFSIKGMAPGNHTITLTVRDTEYAMSSSVSINIEAIGGPDTNGDDDDPSVGEGTSMLLILILILVLVVIVVDVYIVAGRRRRAEARFPGDEYAEEREQVEVSFPAPPPPVTGTGGMVLEEATSGTMVWRPSETPTAPDEVPYAPAPEAEPAPTTYVPPPPPEPVAEPTYPEPVVPQLEDVDVLGAPGMNATEIALAMEEREVMRALTQLPQGLPTALGGWDMAALARAVLSGERRVLPDGTEVVNINGKWYNADRTNVGRFMREHKEQEVAKATPVPVKDVQEKLDKLEDALLEGRISEQTYKELKAKYER